MKESKEQGRVTELPNAHGEVKGSAMPSHWLSQLLGIPGSCWVMPVMLSHTFSPLAPCTVCCLSAGENLQHQQWKPALKNKEEQTGWESSRRAWCG